MRKPPAPTQSFPRSYIKWQPNLVTHEQHHPFLVTTPTEENPERQSYSRHAACPAHVVQLQSNPYSKTEVYITVGYRCELYIYNCSNKLLRRITAQFGQDLIGLTSRLAAIQALRIMIELLWHVKCATIEYYTQAFEQLKFDCCDSEEDESS